MLSTKQNTNFNAALLEKVITNNDLAGLSPIEKVEHIKNICLSLGLNPLTKPIQLLKFQGKEIAYFTKDATEQLRKNNNVSITKVEKSIENDICMITVYAETPDGRKDASTGAVSIAGVKGDALCNAILKAETKAKRRVTLSICGLGMIDESEAESIPAAKKVDPSLAIDEMNNIKSVDVDDMILEMSQAFTLDELQDIYTKHYRTCTTARDMAAMKALISAKDKIKAEIQGNKVEVEVAEGK